MTILGKAEPASPSGPRPAPKILNPYSVSHRPAAVDAYLTTPANVFARSANTLAARHAKGVLSAEQYYTEMLHTVLTYQVAKEAESGI